jgi:hypothetical protein
MPSAVSWYPGPQPKVDLEQPGLVRKRVAIMLAIALPICVYLALFPPQIFHRGLEHGHRFGLERAKLAHLARGHATIDLRSLGSETPGLARPRFENLRPQVGRPQARGYLGQSSGGDGRDLDVRSIRPKRELETRLKYFSAPDGVQLQEWNALDQ